MIRAAIAGMRLTGGTLVKFPSGLGSLLCQVVLGVPHRLYSDRQSILSFVIES